MSAVLANPYGLGHPPALPTTLSVPAPEVVIANARRALDAAEARVTNLKRRVEELNLVKMQSDHDTAAHKLKITAALVEGKPLPKGAPPPEIDPGHALVIVKHELTEANAHLTEARGRHRGALVNLLQTRRAEALDAYRAATKHLREVIVTMAAYDHLIVHAGPASAIPVTIVSRLGVPALPGDPVCCPGMAIDGRSLQASGDIVKESGAIRNKVQAEFGPLPF